MDLPPRSTPGESSAGTPALSTLAAVAAEILAEPVELLEDTRRLRDDGIELHLPGCTLAADEGALDLWAEQTRPISLAEALSRLVSVAPGCPCIPAGDPWDGELARLVPALYQFDRVLDAAATVDNVLRADTPLPIHLSAIGAARLRTLLQSAGSPAWAAALRELEAVRRRALQAGGAALTTALANPPPSRPPAPDVLSEQLAGHMSRAALSGEITTLLATTPGPPPSELPPQVVGLSQPHRAGLYALTLGELLAATLPPSSPHPRILLTLPAPAARGLQGWEPSTEVLTATESTELLADSVLAHLTLSCWEPPTSLTEALALARAALRLSS